MTLNPEVILEIIPGFERKGWSREEIVQSWQDARYVDAVKNGRIHVVQGSWADVPGPRFVLLLEDIAGYLHPEARP